MNQNQVIEIDSSSPAQNIVGKKIASLLKPFVPDLFKELPKAPPLDELIKRGFQPKNGVIDILLIFPPSSVAERYGKENVGKSGGDILPLGIAYIASYLREKGLGVGVLDTCALGLDYSQVLEIIEVWQPKCVGISSTTFLLNKSVALARQIKSRFPEKLLVLGGAHANVAPLDAMENHDCFDVLVWGEGEITIHVFLQEFARHNYNAKKFYHMGFSYKALGYTSFYGIGRGLTGIGGNAVGGVTSLSSPVGIPGLLGSGGTGDRSGGVLGTGTVGGLQGSGGPGIL